MEWDQIANRWAAMTDRLRSDRIASLQYDGGARGIRRILIAAVEEVSDSMPPETPGNGNGARPNQ